MGWQAEAPFEPSGYLVKFGELQWSVEEFPLPSSWPVNWSLSSLIIITIGQEWPLQSGHTVLLTVTGKSPKKLYHLQNMPSQPGKLISQANSLASFWPTIMQIAAWPGALPLPDRSVISRPWSGFLHLLHPAHLDILLLSWLSSTA